VLRRKLRDSGLVTFAKTAVDLERKTVCVNDEPVELTAQEFKLLAHFVSHPGRTFSREELISGAWGFDYEGTARTVDNFVSQLRQKFEPQPDEPKHFRTVRGLGYRFDS
jgi:two-component system, OmpR family, alkaline phosphatase synthesis response regulator PhoP